MSWVGYLFLTLSALLVGQALWVKLASGAMRGKSVAALAEVFPELRAQGRAAIYCHSAHCAPCRRLTPALAELEQGHAHLYRLDIGTHPALARRLGVRATPTTLLVEDGRVLKVIVGDPLPALRTFLPAA
jgi:thioredoxin-like negative regulator of GroEL